MRTMKLTKEDIFTISNLPTKQSKIAAIKSRIVDYEPHTHSDPYRIEIIVDSFYDLIETGLAKGYTLRELVECCRLLEELFTRIRQKFSLSETFDSFVQSMSGLSLLMSAARTNELIAYMEQTIFSHFMLYRYVLNFERDRRVLEDYKPMYTPPTALAERKRLSEAKTSAAWHHEQQMKSLEEREAVVKSKFEASRGRLDEIERQALSRALAATDNRVDDGDAPFDEQTVKKMIDELAMPVLAAASNTIRNDMDETNERVMLTYQKNHLHAVAAAANAAANANANRKQSITQRNKEKLSNK